MKNILITGAASGIGRRLVTTLAARGDAVFATDVSGDALRKAADEEGWVARTVRIEVLDVREEEDWSRAVAQFLYGFGPLDVLVNSAGVVRPASVDRLSAGSIDLEVDVNLKGVILGCKSASAAMIEQGHGHIVNIASFAALAPVPGIAVYSATKFGVRAFTFAAAHELADKNVTLTVVCPDAVDTPMVDYQIDFPEAAMTFSAPKILSPQHVADIIVRDAIDRRRREVCIPYGRSLVAKSTALMPHWLARILTRLIRSKGRSIQRKLADRRSNKPS